MKIRFCSLYNFTNREELYKAMGLSKQRIKKYLNARQRQYAVRQKDELEIDINLLNHLMINPEYSGNKSLILDEDDNFLVIHKAHKIYSHPLSYNETNNTLSFLRKDYFNLLRVNKYQYDRGLIYRLDFETSGLLMFCKDTYLYEDLRGNYNQVVEMKEYIALVEGNISDQSTYDYLNTSKKIVEIDDEGMEANIDIKNLHYFEDQNLSFIKVRLYEGLRHQIRVLTKAIGFPILGDELYEGKVSDRLYLHCFKIAIKGHGTYKSEQLHCFSKKLNISLEKLVNLANSYSFS